MPVTKNKMATSCLSVCFGIFLTISLLLYVGEMILNSIYMYQVFADEVRRPWFTFMVGFLLLPTVLVQLVSAVLLLAKRGDNLTPCRSFGIAVLHILQLGFFWRHISLFREEDPTWKAKDLADLSLLQMLHTFTSMLPLLLIQSFMILHYDVTDGMSLATTTLTFAASCWYIASFRRHHHGGSIEDIVITWPGTIFRLLWRAGELLSRIISLTVFTSIYYYWLFLILGLHGLTMLVCLCTSVLGMFEKSGLSKCNKVFLGLIVAYMYSFCFINTCPENTVFRYTLFYIVMFLENVVLIAVWYIRADQSDGGTKVNTIVFISTIAFFIGVISLIVYYKFFHVGSTSETEKSHACDKDGCINCRLSLCSKHNIKLQRPFSAGWISQYQQALFNGNYYKNILQDSLIDSEWESVSCQLNSSGEHWQIRDSELDSIPPDKKQYTSVTASGSYAHKRFFDSNTDITGELDSDDSSVISEEYHQRWHAMDGSVCSQCSVNVARSVMSSTTHLLTDSWDSLLNDDDSAIYSKPNQTKKVDIVASLIRKNLDNGILSDGYTTDHTLDSYQLPITVLAKKKTRMNNRDRIEPAYSTASDSTDCTICAFMKQNPPTPVGRRKKIYYEERIPEESSREMDFEYSQVNRSKYTGASRHTKDSGKYKESKHRSKSHPRYSKDSKIHRSRPEKVLESFTLNPVNKTPETSLPPPAIRITFHGNKTNGQKYKPNQDSSEPKRRTLVNVSEAVAIRDSQRLNRFKPSYHSDSGDSAFPRNTPLSSYLAATDEDVEGISESSLEMII